MPSTFEFTSVRKDINAEPAARYRLSGSTVILVLLAMSTIDRRDMWVNNGQPLNDVQWDFLRNWIDVASYEMTQGY